MKNILSIFTISSLLVFTSLNTRAQTESMEIGLRFASGAVLGVDFAMPLRLYSKRIHANVTIINGGASLSGFYDWQFPFAEGFFIYSGGGTTASIQHSIFDIAIGGEIGFEYQFIFPLTIAIDYEPMLRVTNNVGYAGALGINARWRLSHLLNYRTRTR